MLDSYSDYQIAWGAFVLGGLCCSIATWMMFRPLGRAWAHFFVITVLVLLFTPYAVDGEKMIMAPGIFHLAFGFFDSGFVVIKPVVKLMLGIWAIAQVLSLIYQLLTRNWVKSSESADDVPVYDKTSSYDDPADILMSSSVRDLSYTERAARDELLSEVPIRATR
jgi:hypothetical protein